MQNFLVVTILGFLLSGPGLAQSLGKSQDPFHMKMHESMAEMHKQMQAAPMNGDADHDFVSMMIPHHQGAVDMAKLVLEFGHDEKIRKMAEAIVASQEKEIREMKAWLEKNNSATSH